MVELHISEVIRNYATAIALVVGGVWAFYRWSFSEWFRRKKEMSAIDGVLDVKVIQNSTNTAYVTLQATWNNRSPLPIQVCTIKTRIEDYDEALVYGRQA